MPRLHPNGEIATRKARPEDLASILLLHQKAFPNTAITDLGSPFMWRYYRQIMNHRNGILLVAEGQKGVVGFAAGMFGPEQFYRAMIAESWRFVGPVSWGLLRRPRLLVHLVYGVERILRAKPRQQIANRCELSLMAVASEHSGRGVGGALALAFLEEAWQHGANVVCLTTDAERNDSVNRFYSRLGFRLNATFRQCGGCLTNEYVYPSPLGAMKSRANGSEFPT